MELREEQLSRLRTVNYLSGVEGEAVNCLYGVEGGAVKCLCGVEGGAINCLWSRGRSS